MNPRPLSTRTCLLLILSFGFVIYSNTLHAPFYFDDYPNILNNSRVQNLWDWASLFNDNPTRFLSHFSFAINYEMGGTSPLGYHIVNISLHLLNSLLVFGIARLLSATPALQENLPLHASVNLIAFAAAKIFMFHPP